ncbi:MAG TPA: hypothetical protein VFX79_03310 [Candidatus Saccharimonadales bacterium]|nr:hypothetical protein [Candidatus Saccharimonadales bacterium]
MNLNIEFTPELIVLTAIGVFLVLVVLGLIIFFYSKKLRPKKIRKKWNKIKTQLPKQDQWKEALAEADRLLDEALKKKKYTGKTVGEKLVKAEKIFTDKDEVWFGHKLSRAVQEKPGLKLKKADMKRALLGLQKGLKDLGAL